MTEFIYNNTKNANTSYTFFKLNCDYYFHIFYKKDINLHFKSKLANELLKKLYELIIIFRKNFYYI